MVKKKPAKIAGFFVSTNYRSVNKTKRHGAVAGCNQLAAWLAHLILSDPDAVTSHTGVAVNCKSVLANATDFSTDVLDAKTLGSGSGSDSFASAQGLEQFESFGVFIETHNNLLSLKDAVVHSM
jgi:hypothetical protein